MNEDKRYSSKILLFGEYTVLHGSKALAMPFPKYFGKWIYDTSHRSRQQIAKLKQYLLTIYRAGKIDDFDFDELERLTSRGLAFESNIPQGYGVGSSGSVTAAVYDLFYKRNNGVTITELKSVLGLIESCYHGESSGVDPLVSYLGQPILLHNKETVELLDNVNHEINKSIYLIDTKIQRSTAALVEAYQLTRRENEEFIMQMQIIAEINDELIDSYLLDDRTRFAKKMKELSEYQYNTMKMLIPEKYSSMWKKGLETGEYSMKINGAGGGGFLMVMKHDQSCLSDQDLIPIV